MPTIVGGSQIALGTKQDLLVQVTDVAGTVDDLAPLSPKYTVKDDSGNFGYNDQVATAIDMTVYCLIDTTVDPAGAFTWVAGAHYLLWVRFTVATEIPFLGPFDFFLI